MSRATSKSRIRVVSAAIARQGRYLITQRTANAVLPLLWEFPGGRVEEGESDEVALRRELAFRIGVHTEVGELLSSTAREYESYVVDLHLYRCTLLGEPEARRVHAVAWVRAEEFGDYTFTPADAQSMDALLFGHTGVARQ